MLKFLFAVTTTAAALAAADTALSYLFAALPDIAFVAILAATVTAIMAYITTHTEG